MPKSEAKTPPRSMSADHQRREAGGAGQAHVGEVGSRRLISAGLPGALADDDVEPLAQVGERLEHDRAKLVLERLVRARVGVGIRCVPMTTTWLWRAPRRA